MRKLLVRAGLPLLAALALAGTSTTLAQADPPTYDKYCTTKVIANAYVLAETCVNVTVADAVYVNATLRVSSALPYPVSVRADLIVGSTVYTGYTVRVEPNSEGSSWTDAVRNPPMRPADMLARGNISAGLWWWDVYNK